METNAQKIQLYREAYLDEHLNNNVQSMGGIKLIRIRVRNGKVQRRVKKSAVKGFKVLNGRVTRMSPLERRHRMMGQRRGKIKRRSKMRQILRKRMMSLRRRHNLGL